MIKKVIPIDLTRAARAVVADGEDCYYVTLLLSGGGKDVFMELDDKIEAMRLVMTINAGLRGDDKDSFVSSISKPIEIGVFKSILNLVKRLFKQNS